MELYRKYRPSDFDEVFGQKEAVGVIKGWLAKDSVPHAIMLEGESGCGKTTLARILASKLGCNDEFSYQEMNVSIENGVGMVANLLADCKRNFTGGNRVWVMDECFHSDTLIDTVNGKKRIADICEGDGVISAYGRDKVRRVFKNKVPLHRLCNVVLGNGQFIHTTVDHLFFTDKG